MKIKHNLSFVERLNRFVLYSFREKFFVTKNIVKNIWNKMNIFKIKRMDAGFILYVSPDIFGESLKKGKIDENETRLIKKLDLKDKTVYDIGAYHGYYSLLFWKAVGAKGKVFAFEPSPRERMYFRISQFLNASKNVCLIPLGVSSRNGKSTFYQVRGVWTGLNSLRPPKDKNYIFSTRKFTVDLIKLDSFVSPKNRPVLIKIDAEGAEYSIIKGASKLLGSTPPLLLMEMEDKRSKAWGYKVSELVSYLKEFGYSLFKINDRGLLTKIQTEKIYEGNYFLIPKTLIDKYRYLVLNH